jgi:Flp pilus assembly protein TadB
MSSPPERIEERPSDNRKQGQTVIIVSRPAGFFAKAVGLVAAILLLSIAFVFSLIVFAIVAALALLLLTYLWWVRRRALRLHDNKAG